MEFNPNQFIAHGGLQYSLSRPNDIWLFGTESHMYSEQSATGLESDPLSANTAMMTSGLSDPALMTGVQAQDVVNTLSLNSQTGELPFPQTAGLPLPLETNQSRSPSHHEEHRVQFIVNTHQPHSVTRGQHKPEVWESHKATIKSLYIDQGKTLEELSQIMKQRYGFKAT